MTDNRKASLISFFYSLLSLLFISQNSPLCRYNIALDPNVYQGMVKALNHGEVMYSQVFDHKGPFLAELMALLNLLVRHERMTMFIFEVISIWLAVYFSYKIAAQYLDYKLSVLSGILVAGIYFMLPMSETSGSIEELFLGGMVIIFYLWNKYCTKGRLSTSEFILAGTLTGMIFLTKFTASWEGLCLFGLVVLCEVFKNGIKSGLKKAGLLVGGFLLPFIPCGIYCAVTGSLKEAFESYFLFNISYGKNLPEFETPFPGELFFVLVLLLIISIIGLYALDKANVFGMGSLLIFVIGELSMIIISKRYYTYTFVVLVPAVVFAYIWIIKSLKTNLKTYVYRGILAIFLVATVVVNKSIFVQQNWLWCEKTPNECLAEELKELGYKDEPSVLLLEAEYGGVFDFLDTYPKLKYFYSPNINNDADSTISDEQVEYLISAEPDIIILGNPDFMVYLDESYEYFGIYELYALKGQPGFLQMVFVKK